MGCGRATDTEGIFCDTCHKRKWNFESARASLVYEASVKDVIRRLKYGNARYLVLVFASMMADTFLRWCISVDCITYVPMPQKRQKKRGYNQAELLAHAIGKIVQLPTVSLLEKVKYTKNLARMGAEERSQAIVDTFSFCGAEKPRSVLLVDDVFTTGATSNECAKVLRKGGVQKVYVLTLATARIKQILI
ncbi:MAG: ComF family protein [Clostridia bacterium]|nr:ComF family protein [Clostridia bacterium]